MLQGASLQLRVMAYYSSGTATSDVTSQVSSWSSLAPSIATINSSGGVLAIDQGNTAFTASALGLTVRANVTVNVIEHFMTTATDPDIVLLGNAVLTGNGAIDPIGSGWLRLTTNQGNQKGFMTIKETFTLASPIQFDFDFAIWGGTGADGLNIFLYDGLISDSNFVPGPPGGALGYSSDTNGVGMTGGYIGIGLDSYGSYAGSANAVAIKGSVIGFGNGALGDRTNSGSYPSVAKVASPQSLKLSVGEISIRPNGR
jgi:hypothetical protein